MGEQEKAREELERSELTRKEKGRDSSRDSSEDKDRKKKKKKKEKSRDRSSSNSSAESERKKKKRKKASKAASMDEDLFKMVAEVKSRKKKTRSGEDVLVDLMGKKSKQGRLQSTHIFHIEGV